MMVFRKIGLWIIRILFETISVSAVVLLLFLPIGLFFGYTLKNLAIVFSALFVTFFYIYLYEKFNMDEKITCFRLWCLRKFMTEIKPNAEHFHNDIEDWLDEKKYLYFKDGAKFFLFKKRAIEFKLVWG